MPDNNKNEWILLGITAVIAALVTFLITIFTTSNRNENPLGHSSQGRSSSCGSVWEELAETKKEVDRLQSQIDKLDSENRSHHAKRVNYARSYASSSSFVTACSSYFDEYNDDEFNDELLSNDWPQNENVEINSLGKALKLVDNKLKASDTDIELNNILSELQDLCMENPENVEPLYRIGIVHTRLAQDKSDKNVMEHAEKGLNAVKKALNLDDNHAEVHKWYALLLGIRVQFLPLKDQAKDAFYIKKHCEIAHRLNPNDALVHYVLGRYDFEIAGLNWFAKTMAGAFLPDLNSTYDDALKWFIGAEKLFQTQQNFSVREKKENKVMIAKCMIELNRRGEAVAWLRKAENLGTTTLILDNELNSLIQKYC